MKIIKPSVEYWGKAPTDLAGNLALIERSGRLCYKSEDRIAPGTAEKFVEKLTKARHWAMLEHSNFVLRARCERDVSAQEFEALDVGKFLIKYEGPNYFYVGGNLRAWMELNKALSVQSLFNFDWFLFYRGGGKWEVCPHEEIPPELHRHTVKFTCDRGVSHELVRHRLCSFAQESTRYVNYGGKNMEFIEPWWWDDPTKKNVYTHDGNRQCFLELCGWAEDTYKSMILYDATPQAARAVLPNALKTEIVVTADLAEWNHIFKLRTHPSAHPDIVRIMKMAKEAMGL